MASINASELLRRTRRDRRIEILPFMGEPCDVVLKSIPHKDGTFSQTPEAVICKDDWEFTVPKDSTVEWWHPDQVPFQNSIASTSLEHIRFAIIELIFKGEMVYVLTYVYDRKCDGGTETVFSFVMIICDVAMSERICEGWRQEVS